ncbi:uncharacterized protein LOC113874203 [Abrus precatorius]|uniref:Uncharacterized protein LOC113874203 n=1 Tax=Abrus precatorius TaxID=3816 RepID=A0A8B8MJZ5_ABRPR|nr:uncharacterized protein LOC113874203 [Abrus precatorius]
MHEGFRVNVEFELRFHSDSLLITELLVDVENFTTSLTLEFEAEFWYPNSTHHADQLCPKEPRKFFHLVGVFLQKGKKSESESLHSDSEDIINMANRILKEFVAPLMSTIKLWQFTGKDPHKHLKEFRVVCSTMKPHGVEEDHIKLRAFPFSLDGSAKDWLYYLHLGSITSWQDMKRMFLEKFFLASRAASIRKEICGIRQITRETLDEYWERFKKLCASCPHHQISDQLLIQYFYEGLMLMDRSMVNAASGGALVDKTPTAARELIANMAANAQQFGTRAMVSTRGVNKLKTSDTNQQRMENRIEELTTLVRHLALGQTQQPQQSIPTAISVCGICCVPGHATNQCPQMQETNETVAGIFPGKPFQQQQHQRSYNSFSNTYNLRWRDHPNLRYGNSNQFQQQQQQQQQPQYQFRHHIAEQNMRQQYSQQAKADQPQSSSLEPSLVDLVKQMLEVPDSAEHSAAAEKSNSAEIDAAEEQPEPSNKRDSSHSEQNIPLSFPNRVTQNKKIAEVEMDKGIMETFRKVEANIALLEAIKQIPKYAKFLKDLCTHRRRLKGNEKVSMGRNVSAIIQPSISPKCKDPGTFTIPCIIGRKQFSQAMLDLGASINVMPKSVYQSLHI